MALLASLTVLVALLGLLNLLLTVALIKRVREHDTRLGMFSDKGPTTMAEIGERVEEFEATTVDGTTVSRDDLPEGTLVGFFDPQCEVCHEHLPEWAEVAAALPLGRKQALAIIRDDVDKQEMISVVENVANVVVERRRGPVARAFHVKATPAFAILGADQVITAHEYEYDGKAAQ